MKELKDVEIGSIVTVRKVTGKRAVQKELESLGIMSGSDLTLLEVTEPGGSVRVHNGRQEVLLSPEQAACIGVGEHFVRRGEPVLLCGCCATGNMTEMLERMEKCFQAPDNTEEK
ncbi:MAG: ferrous iron transport protein A [Agathobaculum sp.]|jgi:ferrous iron transport protein A|uniref:ferrous iron transport protein A n=1 Tax=Agathobaculum sp. TaxID=2048138 RepID=UPI003D909F67